jgi:hypothetical protein
MGYGVHSSLHLIQSNPIQLDITYLQSLLSFVSLSPPQVKPPNTKTPAHNPLHNQMSATQSETRLGTPFRLGLCTTVTGSGRSVTPQRAGSRKSRASIPDVTFLLYPAKAAKHGNVRPLSGKWDKPVSGDVGWRISMRDDVWHFGLGWVLLEWNEVGLVGVGLGVEGEGRGVDGVGMGFWGGGLGCDGWMY